MAFLGIRSIVHKKFKKRKSSLSEKERTLIVNLVKDLDVCRLNQVWTTDISYIFTDDGTFYLVSFMDLFSRVIVAWDLCLEQKSDNIISVLNMAIKKRNPSPGLIIHSDKGTQFRSELYRSSLRKHNFVFSHTSLNHSCDENSWQESFHGLLKREKLYHIKLHSYEDAYRAIFEYIEGFYNIKRIHSALGYISPMDFEKNCKTPSKTSPNI